MLSQILLDALADINDHLQVIISRTTWSEAEKENLKDFLKVILELSSAAKQRYAKLEENILTSSDEFKEKQDQIRKEIETLSAASKRLLKQKTDQDRELAELESNLKRMLETEQRLSNDWLQGVSQMESRILGMKETIGASVEQLREASREVGSYRVRLQTLKVRIKIETKVKETYEAAQFQARYNAL